jgi:hypothetical protein
MNSQQVNINNANTSNSVTQFSINIGTGGTSFPVSMSTANAKSAVIDAEYCTVALTVDAFLRAGADPTAVSNGTDQFLPAGIYRVSITRGHKLAFILGTGTGTAYITPGA